MNRYWRYRYIFPLLMLLSIGSIPSLAQTIYVYNWSNYIDRNIIIDFEARYKVKVEYKTYDSVAALREILQTLTYESSTATQQIDVIILPGFLLRGLTEQNLLAPIERGRLTHDKDIFKTLLAELRQSSQSIGRTQIFAMPYLWGTLALAYDRRALAKRLNRFPAQSWDIIFNPRFAAQFSDCGIVMSDRPHEMFQLLRNYAGKPPRSIDRDDLIEAEMMLRRIRPYVDVMSGSEAASALAYGDACIAIAQSQEIFQAQQEARAIAEERARDKRRRRQAQVELVYQFPKQGSLLWMDVMVIPIQSRRRAMAHRWIDHILDAENSRRIAEFTRFATPSRAAQKLLPRAMRQSRILYPSLAKRKMLMDGELLDVNDLPDAGLRAREERVWDRFINLRKR